MPDNPSRYTGNQLIWWNIPRHDGASACACAVAQRDGGYEQRIAAKKHVFANFCVVFADTIVIAGNGARSDIAVIANMRITYVTEVMHLHVVTDDSVLRFGEVAEVCPALEMRSRSQPAHWANT